MFSIPVDPSHADMAQRPTPASLAAGRKNKPPAKKPADKAPKPDAPRSPGGKHTEDMLDEALKGTFPASDPVSVTPRK